jgi:hypothetical protein
MKTEILEVRLRFLLPMTALAFHQRVGAVEFDEALAAGAGETVQAVDVLRNVYEPARPSRFGDAETGLTIRDPSRAATTSAKAFSLWAVGRPRRSLRDRQRSA